MATSYHKRWPTSAKQLKLGCIRGRCGVKCFLASIYKPVSRDPNGQELLTFRGLLKSWHATQKCSQASHSGLVLMHMHRMHVFGMLVRIISDVGPVIYV